MIPRKAQQTPPRAELAGPVPPDLHDSPPVAQGRAAGGLGAGVVCRLLFRARSAGIVVADWPLGYWMAAQGAVLVFIAIVGGLLPVAMDRFRARQDAQRCQSARLQPRRYRRRSPCCSARRRGCAALAGCTASCLYVRGCWASWLLMTWAEQPGAVAPLDRAPSSCS